MMTNPKEKNKELIDDEVQNCIGPMGRYQFLIVILLLPCKITTAFHPLGIVFMAPPVSYLCMDQATNGTLGELNKCPCDHPRYDRSLFQDTIIMSWDLICEREWLVSMNQTIFMLGMLLGSFIFGPMSDRFGRKVIIVPVILEVAAGIAASLMTNVWAFIALRFFVGCSIGGTMIISFVLLVEFTGKQYRELVACLIQLPFNLGYLLLPIVGYYIRTWQWIQLTFSLAPLLMIVITYWFLPESPRWLLATGRTKRAIQVLKTAAKVNNRPTDEIESIVKKYQEGKPKEVAKNGNIVDLFRTKNLRRNIICMSLNWIVCSMGFFGLSQYIGTLDGNIFVNVTISACLNLFATLTAYICIKLLARKPSLCTMHIVTSLCMFAIAVIPKEGAIFKVILACIGNVGMFVVFVIVYLYTCELFPTVVRNAAVGTASMLARVGSMTAPFVVSLNTTALWLPPVIFGSAPVIASILCLFLPETKGCDLPNSLADGEAFGKKEKEKIGTVTSQI